MLNLFRKTRLRPIFEAFPVVAIDVGSRGGIEPDLEPMAWAVSAWGFEPDPDALERLHADGPGPWRELHHLPEAVGGSSGVRPLYIPISPEGASLLPRNPVIEREFAYKDLFRIAKVLDVSTIGLEEAIAKYGIPDPAFIKLDVEGAELEVLLGASSVLDRVVAIKTEVAFLPQRVDQPLAIEVTAFLESRGFVLMDFLRPQRWRRFAITGAPYLARYAIPFSKGQLAQGDLLFFRNLDTIAADDDPSIDLQIRLALVALCYGYFDHAYAVFQRVPVESYMAERFPAMDLLASIGDASRRYGRTVCLRSVYQRCRDLVPLTRSLMRSLSR